MTAFVVDASVSIAWVHPAQSTMRAESLLSHIRRGVVAMAPALWPLETANALLALARRGKITNGERELAVAWLSKLPLDLDHEGASMAFGKLVQLASDQGLTIYDATYLELAIRKRLPLASEDGPLRQAARRCRVRLL